MPQKTRANYSDATIRGFINFAFMDYLAARSLLAGDFPSQGTILAVTSLEKLLKSLCLLMGESISVGAGGHELTDMVDKIIANDNVILTNADESFVKYIDKAYKFRYPDNITHPFDIYLPAKRILENLDRVFCKLIESDYVAIINPDKKLYDVYKNRKDKKLTDSAPYYSDIRYEGEKIC